MKSTRIRGVKKIVILRALALGDVLFAIPAIHAIRRTYPQAEITYLSREWLKDFISSHLPQLNRVISLPPAQGAQIAQGLVMPPEAQPVYIQQMRQEAFDLAFQMQGGGLQSNTLINAFQARVTAGARANGAPLLDRWIPYTYYQPEVMRMLDIAGLTGALPDPHHLHPTLPVLDSDLAAAQPFCAQITRPYLVLHPGSTDPRRRWSPGKFAQAANLLQSKYGLAAVITGVDYESQAAAALAQALPGETHNLCGQLSLPALTGLLAQARLVVSNDTGPLHLALALGTPTVGLFWCEYIVNSMPLSRARFIPLISWQRTCPRCGRMMDKQEADQPQLPGCDHYVSFVDTIQPEAVCEASDLLLNT